MKPPSKKGSPDDFQTPPEALSPLLPYLKNKKVIWECASGKGNLTKALQKQGFEVLATDKKQSFLRHSVDCDCIITNPPFSLKQEFLEHAFRLKKPFAFLLPLTTLETPKRQALFKKHGIEIILLDKRINFETPDGKGGGSWFATAWFTHGLKIGKELSFGTITPLPRKTVSRKGK